MAFWAQYAHVFSLLFVVLVFFQVKNHQVQCSSNGTCNLYEGSWVIDDTPPRYNNNTCPFISRGFNCEQNGRPDSEYLKYRWQPSTCNLTRFNGLDFLKRFQGKHIMFVGDSIGVDQYNSLTCLLYNAAPNLKYNTTTTRDGELLRSTFQLMDYDIKVSMDLNHFFVDIIDTPNGKILNLDSIQDGKNWLGVDTLVFNTWHWWPYKKPGQPWDYVQDGKKIYKDIDRIYAFERGLATWATWMDANIDTNKTRVFFQGISPHHYEHIVVNDNAIVVLHSTLKHPTWQICGAQWGQPNANCGGQKRPLPGWEFPGTYPTIPFNVIKSTLEKMRTPVTLLDITTLSFLRIDGHPSYYDGLDGQKGIDCTHWCLAGVPDTWNQIFYNLLFSDQKY